MSQQPVIQVAPVATQEEAKQTEELTSSQKIKAALSAKKISRKGLTPKQQLELAQRGTVGDEQIERRAKEMAARDYADALLMLWMEEDTVNEDIRVPQCDGFNEIMMAEIAITKMALNQLQALVLATKGKDTYVGITAAMGLVGVLNGKIGDIQRALQGSMNLTSTGSITANVVLARDHIASGVKNEFSKTKATSRDVLVNHGLAPGQAQ